MPYDAPPDLPEEKEEATCEADVTVTILEPDHRQGTSGSTWTGVKGVDVTLSGGGQSMNGTTSSDGTVTLSKVPCGSYTITLDQDEFNITALDSLTMTVNAASKNGSEKEIKVKRQLLTVEMYRLPTLFMDSVRVNAGKQPSTSGDPYGHHWFEIYSSESDALNQNPSESYGWWPTGGAGFPDFITGVPGSLNRNRTNDPYHGSYDRSDKKLEDVFFPYVTGGHEASHYKDELRSHSKSFSSSVSNQWSWRTDGGGWHCKTFQAYVMRESKVWKRLGVGWGAFGWSVNT